MINEEKNDIGLSMPVNGISRIKSRAISTVSVGGSVPMLIKPQVLDPIMCRQTVGPRSKLGLKFHVLASDQELRWRFRALKGKLTFAIYRQSLIKANGGRRTHDKEEKNKPDHQHDDLNIELQTMMTVTTGKA
jgi:hypothetical protein